MDFSSNEEIFSLPHFTRINGFDFESSEIGKGNTLDELNFRGWLKSIALRFRFSFIIDSENAVKASQVRFSLPLLLGDDNDMPFSATVTISKVKDFEVEYELSSIKTSRYRLRADEALEHITPELLEMLKEKLPSILASQKTKKALLVKTTGLFKTRSAATSSVERATDPEVLSEFFENILSRDGSQKSVEF